MASELEQQVLPAQTEKRPHTSNDNEENVEEPVSGPAIPQQNDSLNVGPPKPPPRKKRKGLKVFVYLQTLLEALAFQSLYLDRLPSAEMYEKSYMHRGTQCQLYFLLNQIRHCYSRCSYTH